MTVIALQNVTEYQGKSTDIKPIHVRAGSRFHEIDTSRTYYFDGTNWTRQYEAGALGAQSRITFAVSTGVVSYSTTFSAYGRSFTGYLAEIGTNGNTSQIRTFTLTNSNSVSVWSTTLACNTDTGITTALGNSTVYTMTPNIPIDGTYTISLSISTNTTMPSLTEAITFFFQA